MHNIRFIEYTYTYNIFIATYIVFRQKVGYIKPILFCENSERKTKLLSTDITLKLFPTISETHPGHLQERTRCGRR